MKLVLCEGLDDMAVVQGLCMASGLGGLTAPFGGLSNAAQTPLGADDWGLEI